MLPDIHRATQKFYIFLIVYLTGCTPYNPLFFFGFSLSNPIKNIYSNCLFTPPHKYRESALFGSVFCYATQNLFYSYPYCRFYSNLCIGYFIAVLHNGFVFVYKTHRICSSTWGTEPPTGLCFMNSLFILCNFIVA